MRMLAYLVVVKRIREHRPENWDVNCNDLFDLADPSGGVAVPSLKASLGEELCC